MIRMRVSSKQAEAILAQTNTEYVKFQQGMRNHWKTNGQARAQSICWLFCWATTGRGSDEAAAGARQAFNAIFDPPYDWLHQRLPLGVAARLRYKPGDIEQEFTSFIN